MQNLEFMFSKAKREEKEFITTDLDDCYIKAQKYGFINYDKGLFKKIIRRRDLKTNLLTKINDFSELNEFDIISVPTEVKFLSSLTISKRRDISRGQSFEKGIKNGEYVYSKNYGWIDMAHAGFQSKIKRLENLYNQILRASDKMITFPMISGKKNLLTDIDLIINGCVATVNLLEPLPEDRKEKMAQGIVLSILKRTSFEFERIQEKTDFIKKSSYAEEDLPSNIINFYVEIFKYTKEQILEICGALPILESLWIFKRYKFQKNYSFMPILSFAEGKIPKELSAVKEVPEGKFWKFEIQKLGVQIGKNKIK